MDANLYKLSDLNDSEVTLRPKVHELSGLRGCALQRAVRVF